MGGHCFKVLCLLMCAELRPCAMAAGRATTQQGGTQEVGQGFNQLKQGVKEGAEKVRRRPHVLLDCPCSG